MKVELRILLIKIQRANDTSTLHFVETKKILRSMIYHRAVAGDSSGRYMRVTRRCRCSVCSSEEGGPSEEKRQSTVQPQNIVCTKEKTGEEAKRRVIGWLSEMHPSAIRASRKRKNVRRGRSVCLQRLVRSKQKKNTHTHTQTAQGQN